MLMKTVVIKNISLHTTSCGCKPAGVSSFIWRNSQDCAGGFNYNDSFTEKIQIKKFSVNNNLNFSLFLPQCYCITSEHLDYGS